MGTFKEGEMMTRDLREQAHRLLVDIGAIEMCHHDEPVRSVSAQHSRAYALATEQVKQGKVDASREDADRGFCASCAKGREET